MLLNYEFLNLYEELSTLNEAKADAQRLVDFAGQELADKFLALKSKLKSPENDLYYWIKNKTPADLDTFVSSIESTPSKSRAKKDIADSGAKLIQETEHWKVYRITTFEASQKYGRDTQWCITGANGAGDKYWTGYIDQGWQFYFIITKENYSSRGTNSKFAVATIPGDETEIYDQQDDKVSYNKIPYWEEINIPGVDLEDATGPRWYCDSCGRELDEDEWWTDPNGNICCEDCFYDECFTCEQCGETMWHEDAIEINDGYYCYSCAEELDLID